LRTSSPSRAKSADRMDGAMRYCVMAGGEGSENAILLRAPLIALGRFPLLGACRIGAFPTTQLAARGAIKQNAFWVRSTGRGLRLPALTAGFSYGL
jgi:hypothetical protein